MTECVGRRQGYHGRGPAANQVGVQPRYLEHPSKDRPRDGSGEEAHKPTHALSGGETARLLFCRIMLQKPNVLLLDEPTNHLDLESINALNIALQKFEGTVLLATHDQDLMEEVGTRVWHFDAGRIADVKGPYEEFAAATI